VLLTGPREGVESGAQPFLRRDVAVLALVRGDQAHRPVAHAVTVEAALHLRALDRRVRTVRKARVAAAARDQLMVAVLEDDLRGVVLRLGDVAVTRLRARVLVDRRVLQFGEELLERLRVYGRVGSHRDTGADRRAERDDRDGQSEQPAGASSEPERHLDVPLLPRAGRNPHTCYSNNDVIFCSASVTPCFADSYTARSGFSSNASGRPWMNAAYSSTNSSVTSV